MVVFRLIFIGLASFVCACERVGRPVCLSSLYAAIARVCVVFVSVFVFVFVFVGSYLLKYMCVRCLTCVAVAVSHLWC